MDLLPGLLVYAGMTRGVLLISCLAAFSGLCFDGLSANPLGVSIFPLAIIGLATQHYRDLVMREHVGVQMALGFIASLLAPALSLLLLVSMGQEPLFSWRTWGQLLILGLAGALTTPILFCLLDVLNRAFSYPIVSETSFRNDREIKRGRFREDLYFRLGAFVIAIPPLRDRPEDVPALVHEFLRQSAARLKKDVQAISSEAMTALVRYAWPGNARELEHAIERAVILARARVIGVRDLPPEVREQPADVISRGPLDLKGNEPALIREALRRFRGNRKRAAAALNISPVTLWRKMKRLGIDAE